MKSRPTPFALRPITFCVMAACCELAAANPTGASVAAGSASFQNAARTLTVTNTPGTIINWQGFSIGTGETTRFVQQSAASAVLNRVVGRDPSSLLGSLTSNGRVFLVNPHGIVVGAGARIDTAGFIASTLNITDADFLQGRLKFEGGGAGVLRNAGTIQASGDIILVGPQIENTGIIRSENGAVLLAAGRKLTITSPDAQGVRFELQSPSDSALNVGTLDARSAATMFAGTLKHSGDIKVGGATVDDAGRVTLIAQKDAIVDRTATITANGARGGEVTVRSSELTWVEGSIEAKGSAGPGGTVHLLGERVGVAGKVDASGETGGGTILVGGDFQGKNPDVPNAKASYLAPDGKLEANAVTAGDGGKVIVWADDTTRVYGSISARGGAQSGNGGLVETSGHYLEVTKPADVGAPAGRRGEWLLDPGQVTITAVGGDLNITPATPFGPAVANGISTLSAATINIALLAGDVTILTGIAPGGPGNGDIVFDATGGLVIDKQDMGVSSVLRLDAARDIRFTNGLTTFRTSGGGIPVLNVELRPGLGGTGGGVFTDAGASVTIARNSGAGGVGVTVRDGATWQNSGTVSVGLAGVIRLFDGAQFASFVNQPGAILNINTPGGTAILSDPVTPNGVIQNAGTLNVNVEAAVEAAFSNSGQVNINTAGVFVVENAQTIAGTVAFTAGGGLVLPRTFGIGALFDGTTFTGTGAISLGGGAIASSAATFSGVVAANTTLNVLSRGAATFDTAPSTINNVTVAGGPPIGTLVSTLGTGVTITNDLTVAGGSATFNGPTTIGSDVTLIGGDLSGAGALNAATLSWFGGGLIQGPGVKTFTTVSSSDSGGTPHLAGNVALAPGGTWSHTGVMAQDGAGQLTIGAGAVVTNNTLATWNLTSSATEAILGTGRFENAGAFSDTNPIAHEHRIISAFSNTGTVNVGGATTLRLGPGGPSPDTGLISAIGIVEFDGDRTLGALSTLSTSGRIVVRGGTLTADGVINTTGDVQFVGGTANFGPGAVLTPTTMIVDGGTVDLLRPVNIANNLLIGAGRVNFREPTTVGTTLTLFNSGTLGGTGPVAVTGLMSWDGGTMDGNGTTTVNGGIQIGSGNGVTKTLALDRRLTIPVSATATWIGPGNIVVSGGSRITNLGTWEDQGNSGSIVAGPGGGTFFNQGLYRRTGSGSVSTIGIPFNNDTAPGSVDVQSGTLRLAGGGTTSTRPFSVTGTLDFASNYTVGSDITGTGGVVFSAGTTALNGGTYNVGATTASGGTANFNAGVNVSGVGALSVESGTINFSSGATVAASTLALSSGTLAGSDDVTVSGGGSWSGGSMTGSGTTTVNGDFQILGGNPRALALGRGLTIASGATATWISGPITLSGGARITNLGTWQDDTNDFGTIPAGTGGGTFFNQGLYRRTGLSETAIGVTFDNTATGSVDVQSGGILRLAGGGASSRPFSVTGTVDFASGYTVGAGSDINGTGGVLFSAGTTAINGGTFNVGATTVSGGTANFNAGVTVTNVGALSVQSGTLNLSSGEAIAAPTLTLSGGTLTGSDNVTASGMTTWTGGTMSGPGSTTANGGLSIGGQDPKNLDGRALNNTATATWNGLGGSLDRISTGNGASINNSGTWSDRTGNGAHIANDLGGTMSTFNNTGNYVKSLNAGSMSIDIPYNASGGATSVQTGTLRLTGGGTSTRPFGIAANATLEFGGGTYQLNAGSDFNLVQGRVLVSSGTANFNGGTYDVRGGTTVTTGGTANFIAGANVVNVGPVTINGGTLNLSSGEAVAASTLTISGGTLGGSDTINVSGAMIWTDGTMTGAGITNANTTLAVTGVGFKDLSGGRILNNAGSAEFSNASISGTGEIRIDGGATINNSGTWQDSTRDGRISQAGAANSAFNNMGAYTRTGPGTTVVGAGVAFNNNDTGQVQVQSGTLRLAGGGTSTRPFSVADTATLEIAGAAGYAFNAGTTVSGDGTLRIPGRLDVNAPLSTDTRVRLDNGTVIAAAPVTLNGAFDWIGGELRGPGVLTTGAGSNTTISGTAIASITDTSWNNFGTVTMTGPSRFAFGGDGSVPVALNNRSGGVFNVNTSVTNPFTSFTTTANKGFNNEGELNLNTGPGTIFGVAATNGAAGTINLNTGTLGIGLPSNAGTVNVNNDAILRPATTFTNTGTIGGTGTFDVGTGTLTNDGHLRPGAAAGDTTGTLTIAGNLVQGAGGAVDLELGGTVSGAFDVLSVTGTAALTGTVNVTALPSYTPVVGDAFAVIAAANGRTGNFSTVNKSFATNMTAAYGATSLTFTIGGGPVNAWISGSGDWSVGGNWSLGHVPTTGETALLDQPGTLNITIPSGTFATGAVTSNENLAINAGTLSLANASTIDAAFAMNSGTLAGTGLLTVNGPVTVSGASQLSGRLATSALALSSGALTVNSGGVLNLNTAGRTDLTGGTFGNAGSVNVTGGTLALGSGQDSGVYDIASASVVELAAGARAFNTGIALTGAGTLRLTGATLNVNAPLTQASGSPALDVRAGTVNNAAGIALNGAFSWSGGTIAGAGTLTTGTTATTTIEGMATLSGTRWHNFGPVALTGDGRLVLSGNPTTGITVFDNLSSGVITDTSASATPIGFAATRAMTRFDNRGRFVKAAGSAATQTLDVPMTNTRATLPLPGDGIAVASGVLVANGLDTNAGVIDIAAGTTFSTAGRAFTNTGAGRVQGNGTFDLGGATFTNDAVVAPGQSPGALTIAGNFAQGPGGVLAVEIRGPAQGVDYDVLKVNGNAALGGTLAIDAPATLSPATSFQVITYTTHTGDFAVKTSPPGVPFDATPGPTSYEVRTVTATDASTIPTFSDPLFFPKDPTPRTDVKDQQDPREERRRGLGECR